MNKLKSIIAASLFSTIFYSCLSFSMPSWIPFISKTPAQDQKQDDSSELQSLEGRFYFNMNFGPNFNYNEFKIEPKMVKNGLDGFGFDISAGYHVNDDLAIEIGYLQSSQDYITKLDKDDNEIYNNTSSINGHLNLAYEIKLSERNRGIFKSGVLLSYLPESTTKFFAMEEYQVHPFIEIGYGYRLNNNLSFDVAYEGEIDLTGTKGMLVGGLTYYI